MGCSNIMNESYVCCECHAVILSDDVVQPRYKKAESEPQNFRCPVCLGNSEILENSAEEGDSGYFEGVRRKGVIISKYDPNNKKKDENKK